MESSNNLPFAARAGDIGALSELPTHGANVNMKDQVLAQSFQASSIQSKHEYYVEI